MHKRRGILFIVTSVLALLLAFFAGAAMAQGTGPNATTSETPIATQETPSGTWLQRMQEWMGPEAWGQMIRRMTQVHGAEFAGQMLQQMNENGGCHSHGEGSLEMMGSAVQSFWSGMARGFSGMMRGAGH